MALLLGLYRTRSQSARSDSLAPANSQKKSTSTQLYSDITQAASSTATLPAVLESPAVSTVGIALTDIKGSLGTTALTKPSVLTAMAHTQLATQTALLPLAGCVDT